MFAIRPSTETDSPDLATLHAAAWRYAYAGIIPGLTLERLIARRGAEWWRRRHRRGGATLVLEADGRLAGYVTFGRFRGTPAAGEIYELYLRPEYHGAGLGRRLFAAARSHLAAAGLNRLAVFCLAENTVGCRFYRALGGREHLRIRETLGGASLAKIGFVWD